MKKEKKRTKIRNWTAVHAHFRGGAGTHKKTKKKFSKEACRQKINCKEYYSDEGEEFDDYDF